nr:hypothetical protein [Planctomycetota bacterium]
MSSADLHDLAEARLDGELSDDAWNTVCTEHGEAASAALSQAEARRAAVAALPKPGLPDGLRAQILAATLGATDKPSSERARSDTADLEQVTVIHPRTPWWLIAGPVLLAAALVFAIIPLLQKPLPPSDTGPQLAQSSERPAPAAQPFGLATGETANEPVIALDQVSDDMLLADATVPNSEANSEADSRSQGRQRSAETSALAMADSPSAGAATPPGPSRAAAMPTAAMPAQASAARGPSMAKATDGDVLAMADTASEAEMAVAAEDAVSDEELGSLMAEAKAYREKREPAASPELTANAVPSEVTRDALAAELRRRGSDAEGL